MAYSPFEIFDDAIGEEAKARHRKRRAATCPEVVSGD
jgi:hypothetical protein